MHKLLTWIGSLMRRRRFFASTSTPLGTLGSLTLSSTAFVASIAQTGTILGATPGSTITSSDLPAGLAINSALRTFAWSGGAGSNGTFHLAETLAGYSPRTSAINYTISVASPPPSVVYDTSIGNGVSNGFLFIPFIHLRDGCRKG